MGHKKFAEPDRNQLLFEKGLLFAIWLFSTLFMLLVVFRYTVDISKFMPYIKWYAVLLMAAALLYMLITKLKYPQTTNRIRNFFIGMKSYEQIFMIALFVWFAIVCLVRGIIDQNSYFRIADWWLLDSAVSALLFYPLVYYFSRADKMKAIDTILHIVALSYTLFSAWCLWHVFHLNVITLPSGSQVGLTEHFELCLGCHFNITGALAFTILVIACYMMFLRKTAWKIIYGIVAIIQLYISLLSNSRTVYICVLFLGAACAFLLGLNFAKKKKIVSKLIISSLLAAIFVFALWKLRSVVFSVFNSVTHFIPSTGGSIESTEDMVRDLVGLSGREAIWIGALKAMVSSPGAFLFGVTPFAAPSALHTYGHLSFDPAHAHNIILQVGVSMGVPAMIAFIVFLIIIFLKCFRLVFKATGKDLNRFGMITIIIGSLVLMNMAEAYLVAYYAIMSSVFFLACGSITYNCQTVIIRFRKSQK